MVLKDILLLLAKNFLDREVNKLSFGDHIDIDGKDYLEVPIKGTGLDQFFGTIKFTCEITHENGEINTGKRTDQKYFKLGFHYIVNKYRDNPILSEYVEKANEIFEKSVGLWYRDWESFPDFPKQYIVWGSSYSHFSKKFDYEPSINDGVFGKYKETTYFEKKWDKQCYVQYFIGHTRYEVLTKFLEFWNPWMETLEFLCQYGFKAARLGDILTGKYPSLVFFGLKAMNSYIFTMYNKFKNKENELAKWYVTKFNEYTGQFEQQDLDKAVLDNLFRMTTDYFGWTIWEDLYTRHKLPTEEDVEIISELDPTAFKGSYPAKTFKDWILPSLDCDALPTGMKELPEIASGLEYVQYAEVIG